MKATLKLLTEKGFDGTPISMIAEEAGVAAGTIYRYFKNKEDLINQLYTHVKQEIAAAMFRRFSHALPVRECFFRVFGDLFGYYRVHQQEMLFMEQYTHSPYIYTSTRAENSQLFADMWALFKRAREEQIMKDLPENMLWGIVYGAIKSLVSMFIAGDLELGDAQVEKSMEAIWDAVKR